MCATVTDKLKKQWIQRWEQDNSGVRNGWIKRSDGWIGYVYLKDPNYIIRGDFKCEGGKYVRVWIPFYGRYLLHEVEISRNLDYVMMDVEITEARETRGKDDAEFRKMDEKGGINGAYGADSD